MSYLSNFQLYLVCIVEDSVLQSILALACTNLKENNVLFSRCFPWISLEELSTNKQSEGLSPDLTGAEEEDKPKDMVTQDMEGVHGET